MRLQRSSYGHNTTTQTKRNSETGRLLRGNLTAKWHLLQMRAWDIEISRGATPITLVSSLELKLKNVNIFNFNTFDRRISDKTKNQHQEKSTGKD